MKMMKLAPALAFVALTTPAMAADGAWSFGVTAGTYGAGAELGFRPAERFGLRVNGGFFSYDHEVDVDDIGYDGELDLNSFGLMLDWYPLGGRFRISAGGRFNDNEIAVHATPATNVTVGDVVFTPAEVGSLSGTITTDSFAPALTLGWGGKLKPGFTMSFEVGVMLQGSPKIENLRSTGGLLSNDPALLAELRREELRVEEEARDFKYWPILQLSFLYRF
ncbi:MAG: hypothetical protein DIU56_002385 [Pseudomonadota bacterium]|jgi:hypothetical protein|nr:MAG: hypothetical protein DIU56_06405 [Pseudomonadota bacterium]